MFNILIAESGVYNYKIKINIAEIVVDLQELENYFNYQFSDKNFNSEDPVLKVLIDMNDVYFLFEYMIYFLCYIFYFISIVISSFD